MRIVIHADGDERIGTGHIARALALGEALIHSGHETILATAALSDQLRQRVDAAGIDIVPRTRTPRHADWHVVDAYHLDASARRELAPRSVPRMLIDDLGAPAPDATLVLNQNLYAARIRYGRGPEVLSGPAYALLRPEYAQARATPTSIPRNLSARVLVTMGGADPADATSRVVSILRGAGLPIDVRVVVGPHHPRLTDARRLAHDAGYEVVVDSPSLLQHLEWSDIVISACGTSVLEIVRIGRPIVGVVLADNQRLVARAIEELRIGMIAGEHPGLTPEPLVEAVRALVGDADRRREYVRRAAVLVDGSGANRVVRALVSGPMRMRPATMGDADRLLEWRNDPQTRRSSFNRKPIERDDHLAWMERRIGSPTTVLLLSEVGGQACGMCRFEADQEGSAAISITVAPSHRGKGLAPRLIESGCREAAATLPSLTAVTAEIRHDNRTSIRAFERAGFVHLEDRPDRAIYVRRVQWDNPPHAHRG